MDTNNDPNTGAVPAGQPVPAGRPNQYAGYTQRSVQPGVVALRPHAYPGATPAAPTQSEVNAAAPADNTIQIVTPESSPAVNGQSPTYAEVPSGDSVAVNVAQSVAPGQVVIDAPSSTVPDSQQSEPTFPAFIETPVPTPIILDEPQAAVPDPYSPPQGSVGEPIQVAVTPTVVQQTVPAIPPAPVVQSQFADVEAAPLPPVAPVADITAVPVPSARPSLAPAVQPVGQPIDDFRPMTSAASTPAPVEPAPVSAQPAGPIMNDVFTPPPRPFANPVGTPDAALATTAVAAPAENTEEDDEDATLNHISNHLANEAASQPKQKAHFSFFHRHPKALGALLALFVVLGAGGGFYMMHSGASANPNLVGSWTPFVSKDAAFTAKYITVPHHVKLNSGDGYVETDSFGEYGVRALSGSTSPDTVIAADAINYGNGKVVKQDYKTVSGNDAISGTITGTYKGKPAIMTFQFLITSKDLYELYSVGYGTKPAPNTQFFFTTFKPADSQ